MAASTPGGALFSLDTGIGAFDLGADVLRTDLAVDAAGDVFYTRGTAGSFTLTKYTPTGAVVYQVPFGEVVAADAKGNAYVAASFSAPIDIGLGMMTPQADMDVFVAKLGPDGKPVFARALGLCPDSVRSIAVALDGRIAVSGEEMGTVVLDATGAVLFTRAFAGDVAFDSAGNLIVGGQFSGAIDFGGGAVFKTAAGDIDGFVVKLDGNGNLLWSYQIGDMTLPVTLVPGNRVVSTPTRQLVAAVAVGPHDEIVIAGRFDDDIKLFGSDFAANWVEMAAVPLQSGGFVVAFDTLGAVMLQNARVAVDGYADVAVDLRGNIFVTGKELVDSSAPFRDALLLKIDPQNITSFVQPGQSGAGHAVAVDACGDVLWSASIRKGSPGDVPEAHLFKLVP